MEKYESAQYTAPNGSHFILAELIEGESWVILSQTKEDIENAEDDTLVPYFAEFFFEDREEALNAWIGGIDAMENGWQPGDEDELSIEEYEETSGGVSAKTVAEAAKGVLKMPKKV